MRRPAIPAWCTGAAGGVCADNESEQRSSDSLCLAGLHLFRCLLSIVRLVSTAFGCGAGSGLLPVCARCAGHTTDALSTSSPSLSLPYQVTSPLPRALLAAANPHAAPHSDGQSCSQPATTVDGCTTWAGSTDTFCSADRHQPATCNTAAVISQHQSLTHQPCTQQVTLPHQQQQSSHGGESAHQRHTPLLHHSAHASSHSFCQPQPSGRRSRRLHLISRLLLSTRSHHVSQQRQPGGGCCWTARSSAALSAASVLLHVRSATAAAASSSLGCCQSS